MASNDGEAAVGSDAIVMESLVLTPVLALILSIKTDLIFFLLYIGGFFVLLLFMFLRYLAGVVDDPNIGALTRSLKLSSKLMHLVFVGAVASICLHLGSAITILSPLVMFISIATAAQLSYLFIDEIFLGNYLDAWREITIETTEENYFGNMMEEAIVSWIDYLQDLLHSSSVPEPNERAKAGGFILLVFFCFLIIGLPVWGAIGQVTDSWGVAIMTFLSILFLRDMSRYLYLASGVASNFNQLTLNVKWEILWTASVGMLLVGTLGYDLSAVLELL